jgi:CDP-4-dehydro-6-deoxyglucose reductase
MPKWYQGIIKGVTDLTPHTKSFDLEVEGETAFPFKAGQFITMDLPISEKRLGRWRSYSLANPPRKDNQLELCIVRLDEGNGTKYLFEEVGPGDSIRFKGPDGTFVLPDNLEREIVFLCTGTGVAPFRSMIQHVMNEGLAFERMHLIFGTRTSDDILYEEEFTKLAKEKANFHYDVCLSREEAKDDWPDHYHSGYIHQVYMDRYSEKKDDRLFLICGWSRMIDEAVANLMTKLEYQPQQIKYELYG